MKGIKMEDCYEQLNSMLGDLNTIADSTGVIKSIMITSVYERIKNLHTTLMDKEKQWNEEKRKLIDEIQELKNKRSEGP